MWNNFINPREPLYLIRRVKREPQLALTILSRLPLTGRARVCAAWAHTRSVAKHWWDVPAVVERWNRMISGDPACTHYQYVSKKYLRGRQQARALSLGCGGGTREMEWAATGAFRSIDAYDISENRIRSAREEAARRGLESLVRFHVGDVYEIAVEPESYDVVIAEGSLHHFTPLAPLMNRVHEFLAKDGVFVVNEFVGPSRFQWTDRQIEAVNGLLEVLPTSLKTLANSKHTKVPVIRPSRLGMIVKDPSEAVESSRILPLLHRTFNVHEVRGYGGAILHLLLAGIAHHFVTPDGEARRMLELCFSVEDLLTERGDVGHDFVVVVCGRRTVAGSLPPEYAR